MNAIRRYVTRVLLIVGPLAFVVIETAGGKFP
jgi:hypothetical protein